MFGLSAEEVLDGRGWYNPHWHYENEPEMRAALARVIARWPLALVSGRDLADLRGFVQLDGLLYAGR